MAQPGTADLSDRLTRSSQACFSGRRPRQPCSRRPFSGAQLRPGSLERPAHRHSVLVEAAKQELPLRDPEARFRRWAEAG